MPIKRFLETFRFRIGVYFLIALLPVLIFLAFATEIFLVPPIEKSIKQELANSTRVLTDSLRASAQSAIKNHLKAIAEKNREIAVQQMSLVKHGVLTRQEAIARLRAIFLGQHIGHSGYIYCLNHKGIAVIHPNASVEGTDNRRFGFVREQIEKKEGYLEYEWKNPGESHPRPKALYMAYFKPLDWIISASSYKSEFHELLDIKDFRSAVLSLKFGKKGYACVLNSQGKVLIHPKLKPLDYSSGKIVPPEVLRRILANTTGSVEYNWRIPGEAEPHRKILFFEKIPEYGWNVVSVADFAEMMGPVYLVVRLAYVSAFLILLAAILAAFFLSGRLSRPIDAMMHQLNKNTQNGTLDPLPVFAKDEHGKLAAEFNRFLVTIKTQHLQIRKEHERYRSLFETSPDGILLLRGITLIDCNPAITTIFAGAKESLIGRTILELSPPVQAENQKSSVLAEKITRETAFKKLLTFKWIHKALDGRLFDAEVRLKPFGIENGEPLLVAFIRDVTEQKRVEEALHLTQFSFDKASFGIFRSGSDGQIYNVNEQACKSLGYSGEELCNMTLFDIDPSITEQSYKELWQQRLKTGFSSFETMHRSKDGRIFPVQITSSLLEYAGELFSIAFVRDITEEKEREKQKEDMEKVLQQTQRLEALGTLASGIAHDFNNILSAIIGYTELCQMEAQGNTKIQSHLSQLREAGGRAKNLVRQILSFTRQGVSEKHPIDISKVVNEALDLVIVSIPPTIEIARDIKENLGNVFADETQIHQVIMNLCTNAYQAMEQKGGLLEVKLVPVVISSKDLVSHPDLNPGEYLKLSVTDTGCGLDSEKISKIFDPYFTTKPVGVGTGLGLSTVHRIIKSHGGLIKVYSELNRGTSFQVFLPLTAEESYSLDIIEASLPRGTETILYVDDEEFLIEISRELLENLGYTIKTRASSIDAYEAFKANPEKYDLVISDMTMPKLAGEDLALKIQEIRPGIPIILCTGFSTRLNEARLKSIGIRKVLMKPVTLVELAKSVREVLDGVMA